jgi:hydroxymethylpyrimidine pyrophosphatase-like HAD family hydrolase
MPNAPFIAMNGTMIVDKTTGETLYSCPMETDPGKTAENTLRALPYLKAAYVFPGGHSIMVKLTNEGDFDVTFFETEEKTTLKAKNAVDLNKIFGYPDKSNVYKIVFTVETERSDEAKAAIIERFPDFSVFRSWVNGIEVQSLKADKGKGARMLASLLGDVRLLVCAGDYENDISMVEAADIGYAVAGAHPALKAVADRITTRDCLDGAIAEMIYELDREL